MITLFVILVVLTALYVAEGLRFLWGLFQLKRGQNRIKYDVSVVVAVRNEEKTIGPCLEALVRQTYPQEKYEIIIIDDQSTDTTSEIVNSFEQSTKNVSHLKIQEPEKNWAHKKYALNMGIERSRGEIIVTTDADCLVRPTWIEGMMSYFEPDVGMVVGFSTIVTPHERPSLLENLQALDFLSLMSAAAGTLGRQQPWAASGQNLAYRKEAFYHVDGFHRIRHRASGDDVLLLQLISTRTDWKIRMAISEETFVTTHPEKTLRAFFHQRRRWASNSSIQMNLNKRFFIFLAAAFAFNALLGITLPLSLVLRGISIAPWICFLAKVCVDFAVCTKGACIFRRRDLLKYFPIWEILHLPYIVISGIFGMMGSFTWKERQYSQ